jgi:hypothetical protein
MASKLPEDSSTQDQQIVIVQGPDGWQRRYQVNKETGSLLHVEGPVAIPPFHGQSHIADDPIPLVTTDSPGLLGPDDKAKLDAVVQTRVGILGFAGAGFPDDGGFLQGDIILSAGSEFISLERIGNVVRFTVDSPLPFNCNIEECAQIFWIQDETDTGSIRPPICAGKLPGTSVYGEHKVYLLPESTVVDPVNAKATLETKTQYPALIFKRYDDSIEPGLGEYEAILQRNTNGTTRVGWAMTPGPLGIPEMAWFMGHDDDGGQIRFELGPNSEPGLLGSLLYKGHTITRQAAVITAYTNNVLSTNQYQCRFWDLNGAEPLGTEFTATNLWRYDNAENDGTDLLNPRTLVKDASAGLLEIGTIVQIWEFLIGEQGSERIVRRFFIKEPNLNPDTLWSTAGLVRFGNSLTARGVQIEAGGDTERTSSEENIEDIRLLERTQWGITGFEDPVLIDDDLEATNTVDYNGTYTAVGSQDELLPKPNVEITIASSFTVNALVNRTLEFVNVAGLVGRQFTVVENDGISVKIVGIGPTELDTLTTEAGGTPQQVVIFSESSSSSPSGVPINNRFVANIDYDRNALVVEQLDPDEDVEKPVFLWNRSNHKNVVIRALVGVPEDSKFPPIDILARAQIDSFDDVYMEIVSRGTVAAGPFSGLPFIRVAGVQHGDLPKTGWLRTLTGIYRDRKWKYDHKVSFGGSGANIMLIGQAGEDFLYDEDFVPGDTDDNPTALPSNTTPDNTTVVQLLHEEYDSPCVRLEFSVNSNTDAEAVQLQVKSGTLDMSEPYELDSGLPDDNLVRGMRPGYTISRTMTQDGFITTGIETPESDPQDFVAYDGGPIPSEIDGKTELWNEIKIMYRDDQMWVWWNGVLVPPDTTASALLPTPVGVNTPYFPVVSDFETGKVGLRLWPGAVVREVEIKTQLEQFNEFTLGQLELSDGSGSTGSV